MNECPQKDRHIDYSGCAECGWTPRSIRALEASMKELEYDRNQWEKVANANGIAAQKAEAELAAIRANLAHNAEIDRRYAQPKEADEGILLTKPRRARSAERQE